MSVSEQEEHRKEPYTRAAKIENLISGQIINHHKKQNQNTLLNLRPLVNWLGTCEYKFNQSTCKL